MKKKFGVKQIVLTVVAVLLMAILIAGNIVLSANATLLHALFASFSRGTEGGSGEAFETGNALVPQLVEDSAVLLRNEGALPLDSSKETEKKVNLFGWNATTNGFLLTGVGSGGSPVLDENRVTLAEAFEQAGYSYNEELYNAYATESGAGNDTINKYGQFAKEAQKVIYNPGAAFYTDARMQAAKAYSDVAIIVLSRNTGENCGNGETLNVADTNYNNGTWLELTANEKIMLQKVTDTFEDGKVIVLLNTTNTMELGFLEEYGVDAALYIGAVGQSGARAIPNLLYGEKSESVPELDEDGNVKYDESGAVVYEKNEDGTVKTQKVQLSPSGKTADTYAYNYNLTDGKNYNASWSSAISNNSSLYYQEDIYIGYKWYETADAEGVFDKVGGYEAIVQYPFGYGLSYTTFKWTVESWPDSNKLTEKGEYEVKVKVENTGNHAGKDVVELYYTPPYEPGKIEKSEINLLAFAKTNTLEPGEDQTLTLKFSAYDLASYDAYGKNDNDFIGYELDADTHVIKLMTDAHHDAECYNASGSKVSNTYNLSCDGVQFENDPVTGVEVKNVFTGNDAWDGIPVDGSTAFNGGIEYLSRANGFKNFNPDTTSNTCRALPSKKPAQESATKVWDNADISDIEYEKDAGMYLVTDKDGNKIEDFSKVKASDMAFNKELIAKLSDYGAPEWKAFLNQLSQKEIHDLICDGQFHTIALESVGKNTCQEKDGPSGFNDNSKAGAKSDPKWVVFPVEILLGCSWNTQATYSMGRAMGVIAGDTEIHGWYGPGLNLHRSPYYGRNFEYYSEDAVLTGKLAAECIKGAKEQNLVCYMKHFVCADTGPNSTNWYTWLTEQNLRENYLKAFEIAVKEGGANAAMSGFSAVGATWAGSNYGVSTQVLRNEWGFRGSVITDWYNDYMDLIRGIKGGNDLWLGSNSQKINFNNTAEAYCARQSAKNILYTYVDCAYTALNYDPNAGVNAGTDDYSPLFAALWAVVDILLIAGIAVCVVFIVLPFVKKNKNTPEAQAAAAEGGSDETKETDEAVTDATPTAEETSKPVVETPAEEPVKEEQATPEQTVAETPVEEPAEAPAEEAKPKTTAKKTTTGTKSTSTAKKTTTGTKSTSTAKKSTTGTKSTSTAKKTTTGTKSGTTAKKTTTGTKSGTAAKKTTSQSKPKSEN